MYRKEGEPARRWITAIKAAIPAGLKDAKGNDFDFSQKAFYLCKCHFVESDFSLKQVNGKRCLNSFVTPVCDFKVYDEDDENDDVASVVDQIQHDIEKAMSKFTDAQRKKLLGYKINGWPEEDILAAIALRLQMSQSAYEAVEAKLPLPSLRVLQKKMSQILMTDGMSNDVMNALIADSEHLTETERFAGLIIDETALEPGIQFDPSTKQMVGAVSSEFKDAASPDEPATKLLVVMLKSLLSKKKQAICYYFTGNKVDGKQLKQLILKLIAKIESESSYQIAFVSSDMGGANVGMWKEFGANADKPYADCSERRQPLFFIPDASHLFKNIRNCLLKHDFKLNDGGVVKLDPFKRLFEAVKEGNVSERIHFNPDNLFKLSNYGKMKVKNVEDLVSSEMIKQLTDLQTKDEIFGTDSEAAETACLVKFLEMMGEWFHIMQCTDIESDFCLKPGSHNADVLENVAECFDKMKIRNMSGKEERKRIQRGMIFLSNAAKGLLEHVKKESNGQITSIALGNITSDTVENHFSRMRYRSPKLTAAGVSSVTRMVSLSGSSHLPKNRSSTQPEHSAVVSASAILNISGTRSDKPFDTANFIHPTTDILSPKSHRDVDVRIDEISGRSNKGRCGHCIVFAGTIDFKKHMRKIDQAITINKHFLTSAHGAKLDDLIGWILDSILYNHWGELQCKHNFYDDFVTLFVKDRLKHLSVESSDSHSAFSSMTHARHSLITRKK